MNTKIGNITSAVVQRVGNKSRADGIAFSSELCPMTDVEEHIVNLIKASFKFDNLKQFDAIDSVEFNPAYRFATKIFENEDCIIDQANNLARHLYEQSIHPNIKVGEFYVVHFDNCSFNGVNTDAIGLFKSENQETVIKVQLEDNKLRVKPEHGMSLKKVDKGCIIFNIDMASGYKLAVVDNTNSGSDAHYWVDNFLHVVNCDDNYHNTIQIADLCSGFVRELQKDGEELYCAQRAKMATKLLTSGNDVSIDDVNTIFCDSEEHKVKFSEYKSLYEDRHGLIPREFTSVVKAIKKKAVTRMNSVKLGSDFEIKIINPTAEIEQGYDSQKEMKYYKLYFNEKK